MNAETARNKIPDLVAGRLDEATAREVRAYLLTDDAAREYHDRVKHLYGVAFDLEVDAPEELRPFAHADAAEGDVEAEADTDRPVPRIRRVAASGGTSRRWMWAAALLVIVGGAVVVRLSMSGNDDPAESIGGVASSDEEMSSADEVADPVVASSGGPSTADDRSGDRAATGELATADTTRDAGAAFEPLPFLAVALEMPPLPVAYHTGEWLDSREEAVLTSLYTGRPMLESYTNPKCQVSVKVDKTLCETKCREMLKDFVCYREDFLGKVPEPVRDEVDANEIVRRLPAIRLSGGDCDAEMLWGIGDFADVEDDVLSYAKRCEQRSGRSNVCLDRKSFERNVGILEEAAQLTRSHRFAAALSELDSILRCKASCATAFGDAARRMREQVVAAVDREMGRLDRLADSPGEVSPEQLREFAGRLADSVEGLETYEARARAHASG